MPLTALTNWSSANMCHLVEGPPPNPMCPIRTGISQDFTALQQVAGRELQPRDSIRTCEWFTDRFERMESNYAALLSALDGLNDSADAEALMAPDMDDMVLKHLMAMSSDAEVGEALRRLIRAINNRPVWQSVEDVCDRLLGPSLLRNIQRWAARNERVNEDYRQHEAQEHFVAGLVAVAVVGRRQIAAIARSAFGAIQAFRWAGTGYVPRNAIAQNDQDELPPWGRN